MACKGTCSRYKAQKPMWEWGRYASGQRRCQICEMFIEWDGLWCPCCGYRLRSKPRNSKYKAKLRQDTWVNIEKSKGVSSKELSYWDKAY
jgi:predicted amidophosphoribosyltransferase